MIIHQNVFKSLLKEINKKMEVKQLYMSDAGISTIYCIFAGLVLNSQTAISFHYQFNF